MRMTGKLSNVHFSKEAAVQHINSAYHQDAKV